MSDSFLAVLRESNRQRAEEWQRGAVVSPSFRVMELAGEVGELAGEVKRLERETYGMAGGSTDRSNLANEIADVLISLDSLAMEFDVDLCQCVIAKFNATSQRYGLKTIFQGG